MSNPWNLNDRQVQVMAAMIDAHKCTLSNYPVVFICRVLRIQCGAQKCAAHSLHRLTHERPACERPTRGRRSVGVATAARYRANVTGNSARTDGLHPSLALGLDCTEAATSRSGRPQGHPAVAMGARA